jgi:hypothetical protein
MKVPDTAGAINMKRKYLAFDIETAKLLPENEPDWKSCRPLGIACAATLLADSDELTLWYGEVDRPADRMSQEEAGKLVEYLTAQVKNGYTLVTWNGVGFDLDILAEESGMLGECRKLAVEHVDMMFHLICHLGFGVSLDNAAKGMSIAGKLEGVSGALAPELWAEGRREEVLDYVSQDVRITAELATACEDWGSFRWITQKGKARTMALPEGWLSVDLAEQLPEPNTSWMRDPWVRATFTGWLR